MCTHAHSLAHVQKLEDYLGEIVLSFYCTGLEIKLRSPRLGTTRCHRFSHLLNQPKKL